MRRSYNDFAETLSGLDVPLENSTLLDFWKWAFCDLCDDDVKGIFAEWIIVKLLKSGNPRRISWSNSDIITAGGVRIEVKASAYWQSYKLLDEFGQPRTITGSVRPEAKVIFSGLRSGDATGYQPAMERGLKSHLYVFAFQKEQTPEKWNAMDLDQWEFFLLKKSDLQYKSVSLAELRANHGPSLNASGLREELGKRVQKIEEELTVTQGNRQA